MQVYHSKAALQKSVLLEHIVFLTDEGKASLLLIHLHSKGGEQSVLCRKFSLRSALWEWIIRLLFPKDPRPGAKQKLHLAKGSYLFYSIFFFFSS